MSENASNSEKTIETLEKEFNTCVEKIRNILNGKKDKNQLDNDEKRQLRTEYISAANLAKKLSDRNTDEKEIEKYKEYNRKLLEKAESYGSVMKKTIPTTTLDDVKGLNSVKAVVKTFLFMAKNQEILKYYKMKGGLGLMLYGAPGTGKTMIAEAIANEMKMPLFVVTPADIFKSYVGESEQAVKQIFQEIETCEDGAILFVDECESIFSRRTSDTKDYKAAVTTELLQRINGFGVDGSKRILIGATNRPDMIDPAYLRYKRFSHLIHVTPPDMEARKAIIESKLQGIELADVSIDDILEICNGKCGLKGIRNGVEIAEAYYSSADICGVIEETCRIALEEIIANNSTKHIPLTKEMFKKAFDKVNPSISGELFKQYENFRKASNNKLEITVITPEVKESLYKTAEIIFQIEDDVKDTNNVFAIVDNQKIKCSYRGNNEYSFEQITSQGESFTTKITADGKIGEIRYKIIKGISTKMDF